MAGEVVLAASAARTTTAGTNGTAQLVGGYAKRIMVVLDVTASAVAAGDTADIYIDFSPDGSKWLPGGRFVTQAGNGAAKTECMFFDPTSPGAVTIAVTSDPASGVVRPAVWGKYIRARWIIVDAGGADTSHTFSIKAYVQ
jgi:hypothetical protein